MPTRVWLSMALWAVVAAPLAAEEAPYRAFSDSSYWNTPLAADAPIDPASTRTLEWLKHDNSHPFVRIAGLGASGAWGQPIFWAKEGDPAYEVGATKFKLPGEYAALRIPRDARPDPTSDAEFTLYDLGKGYVSQLWATKFDPKSGKWTAGGGALHYLASNGLDGAWMRTPGADARNRGHRGVPGPVMAVRLDEIKAGTIRHVLKIAVNTTKAAHVFPMTGDEHGTQVADAPPEGARLRIKPSVDLAKRGLSPAALVIATALQQYGAVIGDQSGGPINLKVENTVAEGRGQLWNGVLTAAALSAISLDDYEFVRFGYGEPGSHSSAPSPAAMEGIGQPPGQ